VIDPTPLLELVANLADELDRDYGPDAELVVGLIAVEVLVPDDSDDEDADAGSIIEHRATTKSTAHVLGLVELTNDSLRSDYERGDA
jgi:hypothetical protein